MSMGSGRQGNGSGSAGRFELSEVMTMNFFSFFLSFLFTTVLTSSPFKKSFTNEVTWVVIAHCYFSISCSAKTSCKGLRMCVHVHIWMCASVYVWVFVSWQATEL